MRTSAVIRADAEPYAAPTPIATYARLLKGGWQNAYVGLLERHLADRGLQRIDDADFRLRWLLSHRRRVDLLQFAWRPDQLYAWHRCRDSRRWQLRLQGIRSWAEAAAFVTRLAFARALGYRLVWTVHDVFPPETLDRPPGTVSRRLDRFAQRFLSRACHLLIAHDEWVAASARREFAGGRARFEIVPHGSYLGVYPPGRERGEMRAALRIPPEALTFLCFGKVRADKGLDLVLRAFRALRRDDVVLVVAGQAEDGPSAAGLIRAFHDDARIRPVLGFVPDERVAELFAAADVAVLGRSEVWTSASLILALSLGVPVIAARVGAHEQLLGGGAAGWLFEPNDVRTLLAAMAEAAGDPALVRKKGLAARRQAETLPSWQEIGERTAELMLATIEAPRRRGARLSHQQAS